MAYLRLNMLKVREVQIVIDKGRVLTFVDSLAHVYSGTYARRRDYLDVSERRVALHAVVCEAWNVCFAAG